MTVPRTALYTPPPPFLLAGGLSTADLRDDFSARTYPVMNLAGLGSEQTTGAIITTVASTASKLALQIMGPAAAGGPIGLAIGSAALAITLLSGKIAHLISGCGQVCVEATSIVNEADLAVQQIGSTYWNTAVRTKGFQKFTLDQLTQLFGQVQGMLSQLGPVGEKSAKERLQRGYAAPWCVSNNLAVGVDNVVPPNPTNHLGRCGGWIDVVYDPIANDPDVVADPPAIATAAESIGLTTGGQLNWGMVALLGVGLVLLLTYVL